MSHSYWQRGDLLSKAWAGSLVQDKRDASGLMYRRNRYFDPGTGRFTQPDPIGVGGGLNSYGFAGGDPVNFGDPFGLCKKPKGLKKGEIGVCVESFIAKPGPNVPSFAADHRSFSSTGGTYKTSDRFRVNVQSGQVSDDEMSLGSTLNVPGFGIVEHDITRYAGGGLGVTANAWAHTTLQPFLGAIHYSLQINFERDGTISPCVRIVVESPMG